MMKLDELPQHPDFVILLESLKIRLDNCTADVLRGAKDKDLGNIRYYAGVQVAYATLFEELREAKRKAG